jgi:hypothetical protein
MKRETGQAATGDYIRMPFNRRNLGAEQGLIMGLWLAGLFGDPDTTDNLDGSWDHEFASGGDDLPSYTIERLACRT